MNSPPSSGSASKPATASGDLVATPGMRATDVGFRDVFEYSGIGMALVAPDGRWLQVNPALCQIVGMSSDELLARTFQDITHPDDLDADLEFVRRMLSGEIRSYQMDKRYFHKSGEIVWVNLTVSLVRDPTGAPTYFVAQIKDISERKRNERALRRQALVFETIGDAVIVMDLDGIVRDWNPAAVRLYGYTRDEIVGRPVTTIHRPELEGRLEAEIQDSLRRAGRWSGELPFRRKDGTTGVADIVVVVQRDEHGAPVAWIGVNREATERIEADRQLRRAHAMLAALLDASPVAIVAVDHEHRVTIWNPAAERLFGWAESEVLDRPLPGVDGEHDTGDAVFRGALLAGSRMTGIDIRRRRKDGSPVDVLLSAAPLHDGHGNVVGAVGLFSDMTDHRQLEDQLRQSQKMEAIGQLAGGIAHDFNNLLTVIRTYSEFLADALPEGHPLHTDVVEIQRASGRASSLTKQLLAFSRKQMLQPQVLDLNEVIDGMGPMLQRLIGEDIRVTLALGRSLARVKADRGQIEQVVLNLVVNARDAMPRGGTLVLETAGFDLDDSYSALRSVVVPGPYVMLAVTDTGCGMDAGTRARIFEPFFTTKDVGKGTGLGLSTVYGIVKQSGGYVWVYSEPAQGSTFKVYLPALVDAERVDAAGEPAAPALDGSEVILLVEDESAVRTLARRILERHGYTVLEARDGADAIRVAAHFPTTIHAVVTDIVMPERGGRELVDALRGARPALRVLYMSGYTRDDIVRRGLAADVEPFLQKPFTASALARAVRAVLD